MERVNILNTNKTFLVSSTEVLKVKKLLGISNPDKLIVAGFPVDLEEIEKFAVKWENKIERSVCFLGETRPEKNPDFELEIVKLLIQNGFRCFHFSPTDVSISDDLVRMGVTVLEGLRGIEYYKKAALMQYVVCSSRRESLFVSGVETVALGSVPIMPNNSESGYVDWCPLELMYDYPVAESVLYLINQVGADKTNSIDVSFYRNNDYFSRLKSAMGVQNG